MSHIKPKPGQAVDDKGRPLYVIGEGRSIKPLMLPAEPVTQPDPKPKKKGK